MSWPIPLRDYGAMSGLVHGAVAAALLATTAFAASATLRLRSLAELILAAYLFAFAEVVMLVLLLSPFGAVERPALLVGLALVCVIVVGIWGWRGRPRPEASGLRRIGAILQTNRVVALLAAVVTLALIYTVALIAGTAPNNGDSLAYHLARAAFWRQEGRVGYISDAYDERLNTFPPNGEIVLTLILEVTRSERAVGFVQFASALTCALGVFALARRVGSSEREAAFGALVFLTLPTVLLQASTTKNDLVLTALLLAATVFLMGHSRFPNLFLVALAVALALGTKVLAVFALPLLCLVAVGAQPPDRRAPRLLALVAGTAVGSYWYMVNIAETGRVLGHLTEHRSVVLHVQENVLTASAFVLDTFDLSGAVNADLFVYIVVGAVLVVSSILARRRDYIDSGSALLRGGLFVAVIPFGVLMGSYLLWHVFETLDDVLEAPAGRLPVRRWVAPTEASESFSWFGPVGLLLLFGILAATVVLARRHSLPRLAVLFALAPLLWLVFISLSLPYDRSEGRYFIFPIALSASLWGLVLRVPSAAWATCAMGATTAALSLVHFVEKPSGVRLFEGDVPETIWGAERWRVHSVHQPRTPRMALRFLSELPHDASVALALGYNDFGYPAFGPNLKRHVELIPAGSSSRLSESEWLLANSRRSREIDRTCWRVVITSPEGWVGFRRRAVACGP